MVRNVLLDLDDTIFDFHKAEGIALSRALTEMGVAVTDAILARYSEINRDRWQRLERGELTRLQVLVSRFELLYGELGVGVSAEKTQALYERYLSIGHHFLPGAEKMLDELYGRFRLYLASNGTACVQEGRIASAGIARYFEDMFISQHIGYDKPSADFFRVAFARIPDFSREETVIVGDSLTSDIRGGNNAGIRTVWYNPKGCARIDGITVDYEIRDLSELAPLLIGL